MSEMDQITLTAVKAFGFHGVLPEERLTGQEFLIDLTVVLDTTDAAQSDDLAETIHYGTLARQVVEAVEGEPVDLIETVAQRVADVALAYRRAVSARVTVHKPNAPIDVPFADVSVTIVRTRS
ncbi:dihydroneopterin aldolase [soil metagenome]